MRFFQFRINTIVFKGIIQIEAQELKTAKKKLAFLVKEPEHWKLENETTIMTINETKLRTDK